MPGSSSLTVTDRWSSAAEIKTSIFREPRRVFGGVADQVHQNLLEADVVDHGLEEIIGRRAGSKSDA